MRVFVQKHILALVLIVLLNSVMVADYFYHGNKSANFDAIAHITTIAQYHKALSDGEFPVGWGDGFANYGLPLGTIAHQIPSYAGGILTFITHDPLLSFNVLYAVFAIFSAIFFYWFVGLFLSESASFLATVFYTLAPYRIINLYMRGAMPEFASAVWIPLLFIALYRLSKSKQIIWFALLIISLVGLILTHPMMLIIYAPIIALWTFFTIRQDVKAWGGIVLSGIIALLISAYYFLPLNLESKYLYHGISQTHYAHNQTTTLDSFINPVWRYNCTYRNDIFGRCHLIKAGVTETIIMLLTTFMGLIIGLSRFIKNKSLKTHLDRVTRYLLENDKGILLGFVIAGGLVSALLSTTFFEPLYEKVRTLGNIQYPWRFLSAYLFFPPIALALLFERVSKMWWSRIVWFVLIAFIVVIRFPQLYAKNYTVLPISTYYFTPINLHSNVMNPIWTADTTSYPVERSKATIIRGEGKIVSRTLKNASRTYQIEAKTPLQVSDNTFYFPGWMVYIDGVSTDIQFQDPSYRGVITFAVPKGKHTVRVVFEDTKIRLFGKLVTIFTLFAVGVSLFVYSKFWSKVKSRKQ